MITDFFCSSLPSGRSPAWDAGNDAEEIGEFCSAAVAGRSNFESFTSRSFKKRELNTDCLHCVQDHDPDLGQVDFAVGVHDAKMADLHEAAW